MGSTATSAPVSMKLPNVKMTDEDYDSGFDQSLIENWDLAGAFQCSICLCIPRHPIYLDGCCHWFCECCIEKHFRINEAMGNDDEVGAQCPLCKSDKRYNVFYTVPFETLITPLQRLYRAIRVKCPYGCEMKGDPIEMDVHQTFDCVKRMVHCPNPKCNVIDTFEHLMSEHFQICPNRNIYCCLCNLPVPETERNSHSCVQRQAQTIECMSINSVDLIFILRSYLHAP